VFGVCSGVQARDWWHCRDTGAGCRPPGNRSKLERSSQTGTDVSPCNAHIITKSLWVVVCGVGSYMMEVNSKEGWDRKLEVELPIMTPLGNSRQKISDTS